MSLRNPKKPGYSSPKAYRPIALLDALGKALEMIVAQRISDCAEYYKLLPEEQFGARRSRSVETALEAITESVHTVWGCGRGCGKGYVASLLSLDVAGAFENVSHQRLLHNLREQRVPERDRPVDHKLSDRQVDLTNDRSVDRTSRTYGDKDSTRIPSLSHSFLVLQRTTPSECAKLILPVLLGAFVDDVHLLAFSKSTERNCQLLEKAHEVCIRWAKTHGASFAPQKYELVHLNRTQKGSI